MGAVDTSTSTVVPTTAQGSSTFDRFAEYRMVLDHFSSIQAERQNATNLFVSLNVVFLTAIGFLLVSSRFDTWWFVGAIAVICAAIFPINLSWRALMKRYSYVSLGFLAHALELEVELYQSLGDPSKIGVYSRLGTMETVRKRGTVQREGFLALYFLGLYPFITSLALLLTSLVMLGVVPPINIH